MATKTLTVWAKRCVGCGEIYGYFENPHHSLSGCGWVDYTPVQIEVPIRAVR